MESCIGCVIAVDCGAEGYFQGKLAEVHMEGDEKAITLTTVFKNGIPCGKSLRLEASSIVELKVLKTKEVATAAVAPKPLPDPPNKAAVKENKKTKAVQRSKSMSSASVLKPSNQGNQGTMEKVSKPVHLKNKPLESGSSSDDEESSSPLSRAELRSKAKNRKHKGGHHHLEDPVSPVKATPTPLFKRFEPQVPKPQLLTAPDWAIRSSKKGKGPCGIPILDVQNGYGTIRKKDPHLDVPIDFDLLATDFDFSSTLQDFDKDHFEANDEAFFEAVEKPKMSQNFAHNENILSDPARITSWTKVTSKHCYSSSESLESHDLLPRTSPTLMSFCPSEFVQLANGSRMPVLDKVIKAKFLQSCRSHLGGSGFSAIVANRLEMIVQEILSKRSTPSDVVLIADQAIAQCASNIAYRLLDRGHTVSIFGLGNAVSSRIKYATALEELPKNPQLAVILHGGYGEDVADWVKQAAEVVAVETRPNMDDFSKLHILMLGTLTSDLFAASPTLLLGRTSFAQLAGTAPTTSARPDCRVADIGVPFSWIVDGGLEALAASFSLSPLATL